MVCYTHKVVQCPVKSYEFFIIIRGSKLISIKTTLIMDEENDSANLTVTRL